MDTPVLQRDGATLRWTWEDGIAIAVDTSMRTRFGKYRATVALQETALFKLDADLHEPRDLETLALYCRSKTDGIEIHPRLLAISAAFDTLHTAEEIIHGAPQGTRGHAVVVSMDEVEEREIDWLWNPYIALGKLCLLDGDPGTGKTGLACMLASAVSRGYPMPDQTGRPTVPTGEPGITLIVAAEDDLADTWKKRLRLADADMSKIKVLDHIVTHQGQKQYFTLEHLPLLEEEVQRYRPKLVYVDSLQLILGGKVDINRANQVVETLEGLIDLAAQYHFALVCTRHPSKPGQNIGRLIHRGMGSQAFIGRARLALYVEEHPLDETKSLLVQSKSNAGGMGVTQVFSKARGEFAWCGVTRVNAQVMAGSGRGPDPRAFIEACFWLETQLQDGYPHDANEILALAQEEDVSSKSIYGAKKALKVVSTQSSTGWIWKLETTRDTGYTGSTGVTGLTGGSDSVIDDEPCIPPSTPDTPVTPVTPDTPVSRVVTEASVKQIVNIASLANLYPSSPGETLPKMILDRSQEPLAGALLGGTSPMTARQIARTVGQDEHATRTQLIRMLHAGIVTQPTPESYALSPRYLATFPAHVTANATTPAEETPVAPGELHVGCGGQWIWAVGKMKCLKCYASAPKKA
jgi:AAA domain